MNFLRTLHDLFSSDKEKGYKPPPPHVVHEAEREDIRRDNRQLDRSLDRMVRQKNIFAQLVDEVVRDVNAERYTNAERRRKNQ